jgi:hypothetical protein
MCHTGIGCKAKKSIATIYGSSKSEKPAFKDDTLTMYQEDFYSQKRVLVAEMVSDIKDQACNSSKSTQQTFRGDTLAG